jgi:hypothetical protein
VSGDRNRETGERKRVERYGAQHKKENRERTETGTWMVLRIFKESVSEEPAKSMWQKTGSCHSQYDKII